MSLIYGARSYFGCQSGSAAVNKDWQPADWHAGRAQSSWALFWISRFIHFGVWLDFSSFFFFWGAAIAATIPFS